MRERIFEAFFTTKEVTGTGLGLWVSHEIILKHGGIVHLRSRTAQGRHRRDMPPEPSSRFSSRRSLPQKQPLQPEHLYKNSSK